MRMHYPRQTALETTMDCLETGPGLNGINLAAWPALLSSLSPIDRNDGRC